MSDSEERPGGRLPLLGRADLVLEQKTLWNKVDATVGAWAGKVGCKSKAADHRFIGPFNPMLRSPDTALTFLQLQTDEAKNTSLSERVRQVVILSMGSVWRFSYELYAPRGCCSPRGPSGGVLSGARALALTAEHAVDDDLYAEALRRFGEKGLVDFAVVAGCYQLVCSLLNLFAIPTPKPA